MKTIKLAPGERLVTKQLNRKGVLPQNIVDAARDLDAGVIVSGTRGNSGLRGLLSSSTADAVLKNAGRPVLIVPPPK